MHGPLAHRMQDFAPSFLHFSVGGVGHGMSTGMHALMWILFAGVIECKFFFSRGKGPLFMVPSSFRVSSQWRAPPSS